ncbi:MAG: valine--tRNA ligase [Candidatus Buchananbacteria bacterium]|nr:valine--tRNA ligase [Candidatus Buchananbacteria bacterium]
MNMSKTEIPKAYEPKTVEDSIYQMWEESGFFNPDNLPKGHKQPFTIAMPPPNATGTLHVGHAVMLAIQDIVIRHQRMKGRKALWLPGTDHAAIATNAKVEKILQDREGKTRFDIGREAFISRVEQFIAESQATIINQVKKMGSSCDWSRLRYTFDEGLSHAVSSAFVEMYNDGLIYRGERIVNWCPHCGSTLADDEVEYKEEMTPFYYFKYGPVVIGTARPETKFGDKVIVVHPDDPRYQDLINKELEVDWILGKIKARVIADSAAEMEMGSGAMTITPGHSFVDFELAQKYGIAIEKIIDESGRLTQAAGELAGLSVKEARRKVVELLQTKNLVDHIDENYVHNLSVCYRCGTPVEPLVSKQWFVDVNKPIKKFGGKTIKERSLEVVRGGEVKIIPERFEKTYYHWMENLRDWCISRQIWFGHRIPVWYRGENQAEIYVGSTPPKGEGWQQDPDTLDTWFSSGLWTFSTLGWPDKTADLKTFHPTSLMETGYDILFFWIARMIIMTTYLIEEIPFETVYLHGLVRDEQGRKMSKSLDNIIDPLDTISKYGADATRLSLVIGMTPGNDTNMSEAKIAGYRNFVNKLWNISRYILMNVKTVRLVESAPKPKTLADEWILAELNELIVSATDNLEKYNLSIVGEKIYEFTWSKLADWYVEIAKIEGDKDELLLYILQTVLKLWHPYTPFVTEEIWKKISPNELLLVQPWPEASGKISKASVAKFGLVKNVITGIRNVRAEAKIAPSQLLDAVVVAPKNSKLFKEQEAVIKTLARLKTLELKTAAAKPSQALAVILPQVEIYLPVSGMIDVAKEVKRLTEEMTRLTDFVQHLEQKLSNERFLERAPKEIIAAEKEKLESNKLKLASINQQLKTLT